MSKLWKRYYDFDEYIDDESGQVSFDFRDDTGLHNWDTLNDACRSDIKFFEQHETPVVFANP